MQKVIVVNSREEADRIYREQIRIPTGDMLEKIRDMMNSEYPCQINIERYSLVAVSYLMMKELPLIIINHNQQNVSNKEMQENLEKVLDQLNKD